jgi:hypothetical protein
MVLSMAAMHILLGVMPFAGSFRLTGIDIFLAYIKHVTVVFNRR